MGPLETLTSSETIARRAPRNCTRPAPHFSILRKAYRLKLPASTACVREGADHVKLAISMALLVDACVSDGTTFRSAFACGYDSRYERHSKPMIPA